MVFSSLPLYQLDPPNWQQQHQQEGFSNNPQLPPPAMPPPPSGSIRPNSMAWRARLTKLPQPEIPQKCPRCESTNTKFCYYNNYSLAQPRHFCKTCRRYWTRGGALRNVPVGGGFRRNKKSKRSRSKSPVITGSSTSGISSSSCTTDIIGQVPPSLGPLPQFPFLPFLHQIRDFGGGDMGLSFGTIQPPATAVGFGDQWRQHQFRLLAGMDQPEAGMYQFQSGGVESSNCVREVTGEFGVKTLDYGLSQIAAVKFEENQGLNFEKNFSGLTGSDHQCWSTTGNAWTDLNNYTASASHL